MKILHDFEKSPELLNGSLAKDRIIKGHLNIQEIYNAPYGVSNY
jgi:hypothetical protein